LQQSKLELHLKVIVPTTSVKSPVRAFWLIAILETMLPHGIRGDNAAEVLEILANSVMNSLHATL
jgi:hypothetical protein